MVKKNLDLISGIIIFLFSTTGFAGISISRGFYVEGNLGYSKINDNDGFSWGLNIGYKLIEQLGFEAGFNAYADEDFTNPSATSTLSKFAKGDQIYAIDLVGKGILPLGDSGFNLFTKLGLAVVHRKLEYNKYNFPAYAPDFDSQNIAGFIGLGASFAITQFLEITAQGNTTVKLDNKIPTMSQATLGLTYMF